MGIDTLTKADLEAELNALKNQLETYRCALDQQEQRISGMVRIAANLTQNSEPQAAMMSIIEDISTLLDADRTTIYELRPNETFLRGLAVQGSSRLEVGIPVGRGVAGKVASLNRPLNLKDAYKHPDFDPKIDMLTGYKTRSMLCVPLRNPNQKVIGVVQVLNKISRPYFSVEDEALLTALASQAAITLEALRLQLRLNLSNAELTDLSHQLERRVEELDLLYRAERELLAATDLRSLAEVALTLAAQVGECDYTAALFIPEGESKGRALVRSDSEIHEGEVEIGEGILGRTLSRGVTQSLVGQDFQTQDFEPSFGKAFNQHVNDAVVIPLRNDAEIVGAICMANFSPPLSLGATPPVTLFELLAAQISRAVHLLLKREMEHQQMRLSTIGQMMSGVLHDLKGPMSIISGYSQLMASIESKEERQDFARRIKRQVTNFNAMSQEIISFARGERRLIKQKILISEFFQRFQESALPEYEEAQMELVLDTGDAKYGFFDPYALLRVVTNIARNARQAMKAGGHFSLSANGGGDQPLKLVLRDNGPGVPEALRARLFDLFTTHGKKDGTGLGLAIVKRIVDEHQGSIKLDTQTNVGTTFTIILPPREDEIPQTEQKSSISEHSEEKT